MPVSKDYIAEHFPDVFLDYINQWRYLESEYYRIPEWRFFKKMANIRQRERLTREYEKKMKSWGLI